MAGDHQPPLLTGGSAHPRHNAVQSPPQQPPPPSETLALPNTPQSQQNDGQHAGITRSTLTKPTILTETLISPPESPLTSPTNSQRRRNKRKKGGKRRSYPNRWLQNKILNLTDVFNPIPFVPKLLDLRKHEVVLKRLGLYDFSKVDLDRSIRTDLLVQLIASYDSKKKCGYVNGTRIRVNRADLARALELPAGKQDKGSGKVKEVDDSEVFSAEAAGFIEDFVFNWVLLHDESWVMPVELVNWTNCIRDGHPEKLDSASLIWYKVEKELAQGDKLVDCYYASHLQQLIRSQHGELFMVDGDGGDGDGGGEENVKADEEHEEKVSIVQEDDVQLIFGPDVEKVVHQDVREDDEMMVDAEESEEAEVEVEKMGEQVIRFPRGELLTVDGGGVDGDEGEEIVKADEEHEEQVSVVQEDDVELTLGPNVEKVVHQDVREDDKTMVDAEKCKEEVEVEVEKMEEQVNQKNDLGEHIFQHCQSSDMKNNEETKDEEVVNEQIEQVDEMEEQVNWKNDLGEHILQRCQSSDMNNYEETKVEEVVDEQIEQMEDEEEEEEEEEGGGRDDDGERFVQGFDIEANDCSMVRDGLPGHIPYSSHGVSANDLFGSRDGLYMSLSGKRVMEPEEDRNHLSGNSKRLKTDTMWDQKENDFGSCMVQMLQWMEKAKMIHNSTEEFYVNSKYHQDSAMNALRGRNQVIEMVIKSKDEELVQKHAEVCRLERELYLMGDLVAGYRKALNDIRFKFSEYRKRFPLQEEPLYKDAGPGGLVLSTRELEKQRLKQEEAMMKFQNFAKSYEEEGVYHMKILGERVLKMAEKLVFVGHEVKRLKEIALQRKETRKPRDELELSPESEENQNSLDNQELSPEPAENQKSLKKHELSPEPEEIKKSHDEVPDNDASMESVTSDADDSEEKGGGEVH